MEVLSTLRGANWKGLWRVTAPITAVLALGYLFPIFWHGYEDRDMRYTNRIFAARADISAFETSIDSYKQKYGRYPNDLADLFISKNEEGPLLPGAKQPMENSLPSDDRTRSGW